MPISLALGILLLRLIIMQRPNIFLKLDHIPNRLPQMAIPQLLFLEPRQLPRRIHAIPDLPPIKLMTRERVQMALDSGVLVQDARLLLEERDEVLPDMGAVVAGQRGVVQGELDARFERLVEGADAVGGEDQDAVVVLQHAQEDGDERVALQVEFRALFEEHVGFVEEHHAVPGGADEEHRVEVLFDFLRIRADVAAGDAVERAGGELGDAFGRERFACAWPAVEED